ncbi:YjcZ family sporulation protein [Cohnella sp. REN36]|nr:YjcZ family sporulation protein [Cohnella sp. REN36]MCC3371564.1 YjcZ family sporulation protein [Cohnella sp. REN36]
MGYGVGGVGASCAGYGSSAAFVLVLFILLVIILRAVWY